MHECVLMDYPATEADRVVRYCSGENKPKLQQLLLVQHLLCTNSCILIVFHLMYRREILIKVVTILCQHLSNVNG